MRTLFTLFFLFSFSIVFGQKDTTWFFGSNGKIVQENNSKFKIVVDYKSHSDVEATTYDLIENKWIKALKEKYSKDKTDGYIVKSKSAFGKDEKELVFTPSENGYFNFTEIKAGKTVRIGKTKNEIPLILEGTVYEYYPNGNKKSQSIYNNNELISDNNWLEDGSEYYNNIFYSVDVNPRFKPGEDILKNHIFGDLQKSSVDYSTIKSDVMVGFVVTKDGKAGGFRILEGKDQYINKIILDSFRSLNGEWQPGYLNGHPVNYFQKFPISFTSYPPIWSVQK